MRILARVIVIDQLLFQVFALLPALFEFFDQTPFSLFKFEHLLTKVRKFIPLSGYVVSSGFQVTVFTEERRSRRPFRDRDAYVVFDCSYLC